MVFHIKLLMFAECVVDQYVGLNVIYFFLFVNNIAEWRDTMNKDEFENKTLDENDFREVVDENNQVIDNNPN